MVQKARLLQYENVDISPYTYLDCVAVHTQWHLSTKDSLSVAYLHFCVPTLEKKKSQSMHTTHKHSKFSRNKTRCSKTYRYSTFLASKRVGPVLRRTIHMYSVWIFIYAKVRHLLSYWLGTTMSQTYCVIVFLLRQFPKGAGRQKNTQVFNLRSATKKRLDGSKMESFLLKTLLRSRMQYAIVSCWKATGSGWT